MNLPTDESELTLSEGLVLTASYRNAETGFGCLNLRNTDPRTGDAKGLKLRIDRWSPEGFKIEHWSAGHAIVICGASRIVVISVGNFQLEVAIPLEYQECETLGQPWIQDGSDILIIASETRVFCVDKRLAIRWCWTVRTYPKNWWRLVRAPKIDGNFVSIPLRSPQKDENIQLDADTAIQMPVNY